MTDSRWGRPAYWRRGQVAHSASLAPLGAITERLPYPWDCCDLSKDSRRSAPLNTWEVANGYGDAVVLSARLRCRTGDFHVIAVTSDPAGAAASNLT